MTKTLMTPSLVIEYANIKRLGFSPCTFAQLHQIEYSEARTCFGFPLWESMLAALVDYSEVLPYTSGNYAIGTLKSYNGVVYRSKLQTTAMPTVVTDWEIAPLFTGDCATSYNSLFCNFIAPYFAHRVLARRLPYIRNLIKDNGVLEYGGENYDTTQEAQFKSLQNAINRDAAECWNNLVHHMSRTAQRDFSTTCYKGWIDYDEKECGETGNCGDNRIRTGLWKFG